MKKTTLSELNARVRPKNLMVISIEDRHFAALKNIRARICHALQIKAVDQIKLHTIAAKIVTALLENDEVMDQLVESAIKTVNDKEGREA